MVQSVQVFGRKKTATAVAYTKKGNGTFMEREGVDKSFCSYFWMVKYNCSLYRSEPNCGL